MVEIQFHKESTKWTKESITEIVEEKLSKKPCPYCMDKKSQLTNFRQPTEFATIHADCTSCHKVVVWHLI